MINGLCKWNQIENKSPKPTTNTTIPLNSSQTAKSPYWMARCLPASISCCSKPVAGSPMGCVRGIRLNMSRISSTVCWASVIFPNFSPLALKNQQFSAIFGNTKKVLNLLILLLLSFVECCWELEYRRLLIHWSQVRILHPEFLAPLNEKLYSFYMFEES